MDNLAVTARLKVFLSHSSTDEKLARQLALDLQSANIDVWLDQWELGVGEEFVQHIEKGIDEAEFVLVLLTPASVTSDWVEREWRQKFNKEAKTKRVAVVPVRGEPCDIPDFLAQRSYADISGGSYPLGFKHLLEIFRHHSDDACIKFPEAMPEEIAVPQSMSPIVTPISLEVSGDLIPLFKPNSQGVSRFLQELAPMMREALQSEFGFPFPGIRVRGNETDMPPCSALIMIDEIPETILTVGIDDVMVDASIELLAELGIKGESRNGPITAPVCTRISASDRTAADDAGLVTRDAAEYLIFALQADIRRMASLFLDTDVTQRLVDAAELTAPKAMSLIELTNILRHLVDEEIAIGDIGRILESLSVYETDLRDTIMLAECARHALREQITQKFIRSEDSLPVFLLEPEIETLVKTAILQTSLGPYLELDPQHTQDILASIRDEVSSLGSVAAGVPILTITEIRRFIRKLVELEFPLLPVLSHQDLEPGTDIEIIARISLPKTSKNHGEQITGTISP